MFAEFFVLILDFIALAHTLIALAHTLIALTHPNSTEKLHRLYRRALKEAGPNLSDTIFKRYA